MPKRLSQSQVIERFISLHGNKYDYSKSVYVNDYTKIEIKCPKHGVFFQTHLAHFRAKQGCPACGNVKKGVTQRKTLDMLITHLIKKTSKEFVNNLDFTKTQYKGMHQKIKVRCKRSGILMNIPPATLQRGLCCKKCGLNAFLKTYHVIHSPIFINKAKRIHGDLFDYSKCNYINSEIPIIIICKYHGEFKQRPAGHLSGRGCPTCCASQGEAKIARYLKEHQIGFIHQYKVKIENSWHWYDFYIPDKNLIIEFHGLQHYMPVKFFGGKKSFKLLQERDQIKLDYCKKHNIKVLVVPYKQKDQIDNVLQKALKI